MKHFLPKAHYAIAWLVCAVLAINMIGCQGVKGAFSAIGTGLASINGHADAIDKIADAIEGNEQQRATIKGHTQGIRGDAKAITKSADDYRQYSEGIESKLEWYYGNPLVRGAVWLWYSLWTCLWVGLGAILIGSLTGFFSPLSIWHTITNFVVEFIPIGQIISWPRAIVTRLRGLKVAKTLVPAVPNTPTAAMGLS